MYKNILRYFAFFVFYSCIALGGESKNKRYGVVMAGGGGKRLWPLSRTDKPKQFISLGYSKTLLENTLERIAPLTSPNCTYVVTTQEHETSVMKFGGKKVDNVIKEPAARNTAPALLMTVLEIYEKDPQAVVFFVPADHYIPDSLLFRASLKQAINHATHHKEIVLIGIQTHRPATEYGYIEYNEQVAEAVFKVKNFHEKPALEVAEQYVKMDTMLWNAGIFCAQAEVFIEEYKAYAPDLFESMMRFKSGKIEYTDIAETSFDKAVLEKSDKCSVVPSCFKWSDVGNLEQFVLAKQEKLETNNVVSYRASNNLVDGTDKLVVLLDVHDLCFIETPDVILIARRSETDKVKEILEQLNKEGFKRYL